MSESVDGSKRYLIGGISGGIGSSLAALLVQQGHQVAGFSQSGMAEGLPSGVKTFTTDATDSQAVESSFQQGVEALGGLDGYIHAIGSVFLKPVHLTQDEEWMRVLSTNLHSAFFCARAAIRHLKASPSSRIVLFSSVAAKIGLSNHEAIAAAKGGINGLTLSLAASYAPRGIRVNAVALGLVETPATQNLLGSEQARKISTAMHPIGRIGNPQEVASFVNWLLSPEADWVTGQIFSMDGGMHSILPKSRA